MPDFPVYLAHDHMQRAEDFQRDLAGGVSGKIVHLTVDSWIDAPTKEEYDHAYDSYDGFRDRGLGALTNLHAVASEPENNVRIVREFRDLETARHMGQLAVIAGNEGGKILGSDPDLLDAWFQLGLRHVQFNWAMPNKLSASQDQEHDPTQPGLTNFGRTTIENMNERGMIVDVSHSAPQTILDALEATSKPILNSHSGGRAIADKSQNLWDDQIRAMAENGGVIGMHFCSRLVLGANGPQAEISDVVRQIRYVADVGGIDVVGLGPDWVLGDPTRDVPYLRNTNQEDLTWTKGLEDSSELPNLWDPLVGAGFTAAEIEMIAGGNMLRLFKDVLPG
ncbi:MAG: membrane dipeptidase [Chloroflexi bacterium]|mgnify:FL=1|nr:membrane dipeptidase [Chloroflexota bacterium]